ncbi:hypothetical protein ST47_g7735 [Ascochyta rabiei]|uniref:Uncharacterized protein n=1 Tax=Didymella rabiei TaxID=5454 RepID=A0A163ADD3_DIDRA|nr:hypothetical protein ST47_g7735 [Ascochyta rabiei]
MQNYGQPVYERPGSTASFTGPPPPPPGPPYHQQQWGQQPPQQQQPQQQQAAPGYNPGTYGVLPGGYAQSSQYPSATHPSDPYAPQPHVDVPPPPPPKPYGFAAAVQKQNSQNPQNWQQPPQTDTSFTPHAQQGGYPVYNNAAQPPSGTPTASYFHSTQVRPGSIYGADHAGLSASPAYQRPQSTVMSPNEQATPYAPPSAPGQGVQTYVPSNTTPVPGVYVPPPPAWHQVQHASLQSGNERFTHANPSADPTFYTQGSQGTQSLPQQPPPLPPRHETHGMPPQQQQHVQHPQSHLPQQPQEQQPPRGHFLQQQQHPQAPAHFGQLGQPVQPLQQQQQQQQQYDQPPLPQSYIQQQAAQLEQYAQTHQQQQVQSPVQPQTQWQAPAPAQINHMQQYPATSQPVYEYQQQQAQTAIQPQFHQPTTGQPYYNVSEQAIQTPKPIDRTDTAPPNFVHQSSPQSHFMSPRTHRFASPKPPSFVNPTPPPPRDDASRFSALGTGGPSDWETLGADEEIDDEAMFAKKDPGHNEPVQLDSVELPAHHPSHPLTQGWPSPANQTAPVNHSQYENYQPTPPTATSFFAKDALITSSQASPKLLQKYETAPDAHHGFVMGEVLWDVPKQIGNAPQQSQLPAPDKRSDGPQSVQLTAPVQVSPPIQVLASNSLAPAPQTPRQTRPGVNRFFSDVGTTWGLSPKDRQQASNLWGSKDDIDLPAKLKAKDEELWNLRRESQSEMQRVQAEIEAGKAEFLARIDRLKADYEVARALASKQSSALEQQVEAMKAATEQAKLDADALRKENDLTIARIKEDVEGKEDTIRERDATIADLRTQLESLRSRLEEEKMKEAPAPPKPTALDLIPDLDPWYAGSLERYMAMLHSEANEPQVEDKIKTFKAFLRAESGIRGIEYHDIAPTPSAAEQIILHQPARPADAQSTSSAAAEKRDLNVTVPHGPPDDDDFEYSPGGRPLLKRTTISVEERVSTHTQFVPSSQSTAILTPTSSVHDDSTPIQSPPDEPQYKAYVPPTMSTGVSASIAQRQATGPSNLPTVASPTGPGKDQDEIFFGAQEPRGRKGSRPTSTDDAGGVPVVAPLNFSSSRPVSMSAAPKGNLLDMLNNLLPSQVKPVAPNPLIEELRTEVATVKSGLKHAEELTKSWEKSASLTRKKNDDARRKRAEDNETHNDDLFNSDEISYAELKDLENEFKEKERNLKSQEDQEECNGYVQTVFDRVYNDLQADITTLTDFYIEAETLLQTSVSGVKSLGGGDAPTTRACLELLVELHDQIEKTHEQVVQAVAERDKRYKKTEIQPLFAAGNIAKMKSVEKHFERAEKQAILRAKNEKAERMGELIKVAEEAVIGAASIEQSERGRIVAAIRELKHDSNTSDILSRAHETLILIQESSKSLLAMFNRLEIGLNTAEVDADVAQARVDGAPPSKVSDLQSGMSARETELKDELTRRLDVLDQDLEEFEQLIKEKGGSVGSNDEQEKSKRLKMALEEAKRRNGHA